MAQSNVLEKRQKQMQGEKQNLKHMVSNCFQKLMSWNNWQYARYFYLSLAYLFLEDGRHESRERRAKRE